MVQLLLIAIFLVSCSPASLKQTEEKFRALEEETVVAEMLAEIKWLIDDDYTNQTQIPFEVNFAQAVNSISPETFTVVNGAVSEIEVDGNRAVGKLVPFFDGQVKLSLVSPVQTPEGLVGVQSNTAEITIDFTQPRILNITSTTPNGTYDKTDPKINVRVEFSEPVAVFGPQGMTGPRVKMALSSQVTAKWNGINQPNEFLDFSFLPGKNDFSIDLKTKANALVLNDAEIRDLAGNLLDMTFPDPEGVTSLYSNKDIQVRSALQQQPVNSGAVVIQAVHAMTATNAVVAERRTNSIGLVFFEKSESIWVKIQEILIANEPYSIGIEANRVILGHSGGVSFYKKDGTWSLDKDFPNTETEECGSVVSMATPNITSKVTAISVCEVDSERRIHGYNLDGGWQKTFQIDKPLPTTNEFGRDLQISNNRIVISAMKKVPLVLDDAGVVFIYKTSDGLSWEIEEEIESSFSSFGISVAQYSNGLLIGVPSLNVNGVLSAGRVYSYSLEGGEWVLKDQLSSPEPEQNGFFGREVALKEAWALVGAVGEFLGKGEVYHYRRLANGHFAHSHDLGTGILIFGSSLSVGGVGEMLSGGINLTGQSGGAHRFIYSF